MTDQRPPHAGDGLDDETFERVAEETRRMPDSGDGYREEPGTGEDEGGRAPEHGGVERVREPPDPGGRRHEPPARLDDPRVPLVPETTVDPAETEAQAAARLRAGRRQDPWGEPEDAPDHAGNEAFEQQRAPRRR